MIGTNTYMKQNSHNCVIEIRIHHLWIIERCVRNLCNYDLPFRRKYTERTTSIQFLSPQNQKFYRHSKLIRRVHCQVYPAPGRSIGWNEVYRSIISNNTTQICIALWRELITNEWWYLGSWIKLKDMARIVGTSIYTAIVAKNSCTPFGLIIAEIWLNVLYFFYNWIKI